MGSGEWPRKEDHEIHDKQVVFHFQFQGESCSIGILRPRGGWIMMDDHTTNSESRRITTNSSSPPTEEANLQTTPGPSQISATPLKVTGPGMRCDE